MNGRSRSASPARSGWRGLSRNPGWMLATCRPNPSGRSPGSTAWDSACATACKRSAQDNRRDVTLLHELVERRDVRVEHRFQPIELHLQRRRQLIEYLLRLRRRRGVGARHHAGERRDLVVQPDRVVERILARAVLHLIDRLLDRRESPLDRVHLLRDALAGVARQAPSARGRAIQLLAYLADPPDRVVRRTHPVADPRSEEHTSELQSRLHLVCRLLLEKKKPRPHTTFRTSPLPSLQRAPRGHKIDSRRDSRRPPTNIAPTTHAGAASNATRA